MNLKKIVRFLLLLTIFNLVVSLVVLYNISPAMAASAWGWCDYPCGGCGMVGMKIATCGGAGCDSCSCIGYDPGYGWISYTEPCPGVGV